MNENIFICISACNEPDLLQTVLSAINNADSPNRLQFGIFEQPLTLEPTDLSSVCADIMHVKVKYDAPLGVGLPRLNASMLHSKKADFYLQIDAHMIFEQHWDTDLIKYYSDISKHSDRVIISTYVPWWYRDSEGSIKLSVNDSIAVDPNSFGNAPHTPVGKLEIDSYTSNLFRNHIPITGARIEWESLSTNYVEHYLTSGHFLFSSIKILEEVAVDPLITWGGEEPIMGLRAWTRGYRIYSIDKPIVWHKNKWGDVIDKDDWRVKGNSLNTTLYDNHRDNMNHAYRRIKDIFLGDLVGYWGAPNIDLLKEYEHTVGVSFKEYYQLLKENLIESKNNVLLRIMYE